MDSLQVENEAKENTESIKNIEDIIKQTNKWIVAFMNKQAAGCP